MLELTNDLIIVGDTPFLFHKDAGLLILADIHLGFEEAMAEKGIFLPRNQLSQLIKDLDKAFGYLEGSIDKVVINGDLKHRYETLSRQERIEISKLMEYLKSRGVDVVFVRGNHDNYASIVTKKYGVEPISYYKIDDILIIHGHVDIADIKDADAILDTTRYIIYGHEHPSISIGDRLGKISKFPCFLEVPLRINDLEITGVVLPAAGSYQAGSQISLNRDNYLSPLTRKYSVIERSKPYLLARGEGVLELPTLGALTPYMGEDHGTDI